MTEDTSGGAPEPPDIRPFGRYNKENNNDAHRQAVIKSHNSDLPRQSLPSLSIRNAIFPIILIGLFFIPQASAQHVLANDAYTSIEPARIAKPTPLLSSITWTVRHIIQGVSHLSGYDISGALQNASNHVADAINISFASSAGAGGIVKRTSTTIAVEAAMIPVLVILSGVFAGLTLGYFSVDPTQLQVLSISGTPKQQEHAKKIMPVRKDSHLLLTTLILCNMIVNEALPEVSNDPLGGGIQAVVVSTALIVIFAEIIPQSICSRFGLLIGAKAARPVRVLIWVFFPIGWPVAKLLEYILGAHHGIVYRRSELRELIKFHAAGGEGGGDLDNDTVTMAQGALDLAQKTVREAMTPIEKVFMLPIEAKLDYETLGHVVRSGHSRVPVFQMVEIPEFTIAGQTVTAGKNKLVKKVLGSLLVKSCVLLDPEDGTPLASVPINAIPTVPCDEPLTNMLNVFQEGRSHMAIVSRRPRRREDDPEDAESAMTAAAGGLKQRFMRKVAEIAHGDKSSSSDTDTSSDDENAAERGEAKTKRKKSKKSKSNGDANTNGQNGHEEQPNKPSQAEEIKAQAEAERKKRSFVLSSLTQLEQTVPADAQLPPYMVEKFFEGLEGAPLGIITLEDVLEELIGEEIYDEYDDNGGPRNAASAFVPREAAMAARKAALDREKALATAVPLPPTNDAEIEHPPPLQPQPSAWRVPKLPMPKFSLGRRPLSQPGKPRVPEMSSSQPVAAPTPPNANATSDMNEKLETLREPVNSGGIPREEVLLEGDQIPVVTSPGELGEEEAGFTTTRSQSERGSRRDTSNSQLQTPLTGVDPVSAVPARLLPGVGAATTPAVAPPNNANLLSEALLMERGRRRLAVQQGQTPPPPMIRIPSSGAIVRSQVPSRVPTPPSGTGNSPILPSKPVMGIPGAGTTSPAVLSPAPIQASRRGTKFKSVPTPIGTPKIGSNDDPMLEMSSIDRGRRQVSGDSQQGE